MSAASSVFMDMFFMPQPPASKESSIPVVLLSEPLLALHLLLQFIYPLREPEITDLSTLICVLESAVKYDAESVIIRLREFLISPKILVAEPMRVYAISCRFEFKEEVKNASKSTLRAAIADFPLSDHFKHMDGYDYHRLMCFHTKCRESAIEIIDKEPMPSSPHCENPTAPFYEGYKKRAKEELAKSPLSDVISTIEFVIPVMLSNNGSSNKFGNSCGNCGTACNRSQQSYRSFITSICTQIDGLSLTV